MIDFHTHILPGIDDGSRDIRMTEALLKEEGRQGVDWIIATPHFYANYMSVEGFLEKREKALEQTRELSARSDEPLPRILAGAEVCYFPGIGQAKAVPRLCIEGTRTLLLEMPFEQWKEETYRDVRDLILKQGLSIALAHIERYPEFQRSKEIWDRILELPLATQINTGSFLRKDGLLFKDRKKKFCLGWLRERPDLLLGSDCHNTDTRKPNLAAGRAEIEKTFGADALARIDALALRLAGLQAERGREEKEDTAPTQE